MAPILAQRSRSARGFERIYRRHVGDVYHYALAVMRNEADAEDVTQTTFLNAFRAFERGERPQKPQNWLIAIAHNVCRQRFRQSARRPQEIAFDEDIGDRLLGAPEEEAAPTAEDIRRALGHLGFNQRAALVMRELEGRSYAEIGEILDLSPSAVETLIFRARRALREQLESSLTCGEAELAISRQLDGQLSRRERGALRAHLRECSECATFARRQRAQRSALRSLAAVPVPASLTSLFGGGGGAAVGTGLALKAGAAVATGLALGGGAYVGVEQAVHHRHHVSAPPAEHVSTPPGKHASTTPPATDASSARGSSTPRPRRHSAALPSANADRPESRAAGRHHGRPVHAYHGDASVAARHNHLGRPKAAPHVQPAHPAHPVHPAHPAGPARGAPAHAPAKPKLQPGPYIGGPPAQGPPPGHEKPK